MRNDTVTVIGAGLAGSEAAWQIANAGHRVRLHEMKPVKFSPAHKSAGFAELICSNSLKAARVDSAAGLLKEEMRRMGSLLVACADACSVPAGGALAVDRDRFSALATERLRAHPNIEVVTGEVTEIPPDGVVVVASGPLTSDALAERITALCGGGLSFFDAAAPIVTRESLDMEHCFSASRYGRGDDDYINCPMNKEEYEAFYEALVSAERAPIHDFDVMNPKVYEGCMPIEVMAQRGHDTIRFGPLKPVGLRVRHDTGAAQRGVRALRRDAPQYVSRFAAAARRGLFLPQAAGPLFCGADDRRRGLYGVRGVRPAGRHERGAQAGGQSAGHPAGNDDVRRAFAPCRAERIEGFSAAGRKFRHFPAD